MLGKGGWSSGRRGKGGGGKNYILKKKGGSVSKESLQSLVKGVFGSFTAEGKKEKREERTFPSPKTLSNREKKEKRLASCIRSE